MARHQPAASTAAPISEAREAGQATALARVLVVDDELDFRKSVSESLRAEGYEVRTACSGRLGLRILDEYTPEVVLTDLVMPEIDGLELIGRGRRKAPHAAFVLMTGQGSARVAVAAMKRGAENYLAKPFELDELSSVVHRAAERAALNREAARLREEVAERYAFERIIGNHPTMQRVLERVAQVARSKATAVISGESGTGKELIAAAIHHGSSRREGPFVRLNCAALAESVLESELFGHERGSFTGATTAREGRFEQADGGTLFLDEVSEIPMAVQVKLLRFLQERELERVGGNRTIQVDTRIIVATNQDLAERVREGAFREDLYYRLNVVGIEVPPLRARRSDIPLLATFFLRRLASENGRSVRGFTAEALGRLVGHDWPGNVRELENVIERAVVMSTGELLGVEDLALREREAIAGDQLDALVPGVTLEEVERIVISRTLESTQGSTGKAAAILGISRRKIQYKLKEWGISSEEVAPTDSEPPEA
jgi:DNA-binding NtrC family response regulator